MGDDPAGLCRKVQLNSAMEAVAESHITIDLLQGELKSTLQ